jgi:hypothetical protein
MKKYRIYYFKCSYTSEWYTTANSAAEAEKKFLAEKGCATILNISEVA